MKLTITTLIENSKGKHLSLLNEHGISFLIEVNNKKILFDTGQSGDFIENASTLGKDLKDIDMVILSHGHYDHTGGFRRFVENVTSDFKLYIHKNAFSRKYSFDNTHYKFSGNSFDKNFLEDNNVESHFVDEDILEIDKGIYITSNFDRVTSFEKINPRFYYENNDKYTLDNFDDEIMLALDTPEGLVVILGCSHPGVINMLKTLIKRTGKSINTIIGGTHLVRADEVRIRQTIEHLKAVGIKKLGISHCTGENAMNQMKQEFGDKYFHNTTGTVLFFDK
ncbi:MBL fold metallo-hydrolase [Vallitalea sp.]|jgi:7,8-dihydropterin-6-yl-methyl-4-(beta-D-ribofuranosyl)aminobenzene 5'-phosphate synthase|uniref:MBL fold metallo-hydrolase n=1 Tax=Vallitalea sp. TaxID=1882829 RepID=UPI0025DAF65D|nr:MBL fold metallo-hydrolase [Vallitalea sp.]MCT4686551.1 MBL fold metallo-hydrolase [Vallitalea sp.]